MVASGYKHSFHVITTGCTLYLYKYFQNFVFLQNIFKNNNIFVKIIQDLVFTEKTPKFDGQYKKQVEET